MTSSLSYREKTRRKGLSATEESLDFVASAIEEAIMLPRVEAVWVGRNHGDITEFFGQVAGVIALVGAIHGKMAAGRGRSAGAQELTTLGRVPCLAGGQLEVQGAPSMRGNQMNLGGAAAAGPADGLGAVFFKAPVPSGCTLTVVLSSDTAAKRMASICSCCNRAKIRSSTPALLQRFIRV